MKGYNLDKPTIEKVLPLTSLQKGILFQSLFNKHDYHIQCAFFLEGEQLSTKKIKNAWNTLVQSYSILRTGFTWHKLDEPLQYVLDNIDPIWIEEDCTLDPYSAEAKLKEIFKNDKALGFEIDKAPLWRMYLLHVTNKNYYLIISFHHLLLDGWSFLQLIREFTNNLTDDRKILPIKSIDNFSDYVQWLNNKPKAYQQQFWLTKLNNYLEPAYLSKLNGSTQNELSDNYEFELSEEMTKSLLALAKMQGITLNSVIQATWSIILSRLTLKNEVAFGVTVSGRDPTFKNVEAVIGLTINTLPLITNINYDLNITQFLVEIHKNNQELQEHGYISLAEIQALSAFKKPIFDHIIVFENLPNSKVQNNKLTIRRVKYESSIGYPLAIVVNPKSRINFRLNYKVEAFAKNDIIFFANLIKLGLQQIIEAVSKDLPVHHILIAGNSDLAKIDKWNATDKLYDFSESIIDLLDKQANINPDKIAITDNHSNINFATLVCETNQIANAFKLLGLQQGDKVGINLKRSISMVKFIIGAIKAGLTYVPLDPSYPAEHLAYIVNDSKPKCIIVDSQATFSSQHEAKIISGAAFEQLASNLDPTTSDVTFDIQDTLYLLYTSGSTGNPKGVLGQHLAILNRNAWLAENYPFTKDEVLALKTTINFLDSVWDILLPLMNGLKLVLMPENILGNISNFIDLLSQHKVTRLSVLPSLITEMISDYPDRIDKLSYLKFIDITGEPLTKHQAKLIVNLFKNRATIINRYGTTEVPSALCYELNQDKNDLNLNSIGKPISNNKAFVVDKHGHHLPIGLYGELNISGICLANGYYNLPELTKHRFKHESLDNFSDFTLYKTGDYVCFDENGDIQYLGRIDNQVNINGCRVELDQISCMTETSPQVKAAVADIKVIDDRKYLICYVVFQKVNEDNKFDTLKRYLRQKLPSYMIPNHIIELEEIPYTPNGKINKLKLPLPNFENDKFNAVPVNDEEFFVLNLFKKILKLNNVNVLDNFFQLGGHSLNLLRLTNEVEKHYPAKLAIADIYENSTVREIASLIRTSTGIREIKHHLKLTRKQGKTPIILIHPSSGLSFCYSQLACELQDYSILGINSPTFSASDKLESVKQIAKLYINNLQLYLDKPFILGGWSFGGIIAYEMACQLSSMNIDINKLVIIDSYILHLMQTNSDINKKIEERLLEKNVAKDSKEWQQFYAEMQHNYCLSKQYIPDTSYHGETILFNAKHNLTSDEKLNIWKQYLTNLKIINVACNHFEIINLPYIRIVTDFIKKNIG